MLLLVLRTAIRQFGGAGRNSPAYAQKVAPVIREFTARYYLNGNRSGGTNGYAAAWRAKPSVGSKEGASSSRRAALHAAVR